MTNQRASGFGPHLLLPASAWPSFERRRLLSMLGTVGAAAASAQLPAERATAARRPRLDYPFTLGVASGDPQPDGVVLWTRLAPEPFACGGGMPPQARVPVDWKLALDPRMRRVVRAGAVFATADLGHTVHLELRGLQPDTEYHYQFRYRNHVSTVGRTRTAPSIASRLESVDLAFVSCQRWEDGYYSTYRRLADDDLDFVLHLGDYIYEGDIAADGKFRHTAVPENARPAPRSLDQWRIRYALYRSDPDLQRAHALFPFVCTWDDHDVQDGWAGDRSPWDGDITELRVAAFQAFYENLPLRAASIPTAAGVRLHRRLTYGDLIQLNVLDGRQHRTVPACGWDEPGWEEADACPAQYEPAVTMLGAEQEGWLLEGLASSTAQWNVLGSNVIMAGFNLDGAQRRWHDGWDGYPAGRNRITRVLRDAEVSNPVVLSGDWHSTFVNDILLDHDRPDSPVVATEFVGTSVSSNGDLEIYGPYYGPMIGFNPHIRYFDGDKRGYVRCHVERGQWRTDLRMVTTVSKPDADAYTLASFVVESGSPGAFEL